MRDEASPSWQRLLLLGCRDRFQRCSAAAAGYTGTFVPLFAWVSRRAPSIGRCLARPTSMHKAERPILIVEDDPSTRMFLADLLQSYGYPVMTATDGEQALTAARDKSPCLILLDLQMPGMDGFAFRAAQLRSPGLANTPVIIISGLDDEVQVARRIGPMAEVRKPIDVDALLEQVALYCERPRR